MANLGYYGRLELPCTCRSKVMLKAIQDIPWKAQMPTLKLRGLLPTQCSVCALDRWMPTLLQRYLEAEHEEFHLVVPKRIYDVATAAVRSSRRGVTGGDTGRDESNRVDLYLRLELDGFLEAGAKEDWIYYPMLHEALSHFLPLVAMQALQAATPLANGQVVVGHATPGLNWLQSFFYCGSSARVHAGIMDPAAGLPVQRRNEDTRVVLSELGSSYPGFLRNLPFTSLAYYDNLGFRDRVADALSIDGTESLMEERLGKYDLDFFLFGKRLADDAGVVVTDPGAVEEDYRSIHGCAPRADDMVTTKRGILSYSDFNAMQYGRLTDHARITGFAAKEIAHARTASHASVRDRPSTSSAANDDSSEPASAPPRTPQIVLLDHGMYVSEDDLAPAASSARQPGTATLSETAASLSEPGAVSSLAAMQTALADVETRVADAIKEVYRDCFPVRIRTVHKYRPGEQPTYSWAKPYGTEAPTLSGIRRRMTADQTATADWLNFQESCIQEFESVWHTGKTYDLVNLSESKGDHGQLPTSLIHKISCTYSRGRPGAIVHRGRQAGEVSEVVRSDGVVVLCHLEGVRPVAIKIAPCFLHSLTHHNAYPTLVNAVLKRYLQSNRKVAFETAEKRRLKEAIHYMIDGMDIVDPKKKDVKHRAHGPFTKEKIKAKLAQLFESMPGDPTFWHELLSPSMTYRRLSEGLKYLEQVVTDQGGKALAQALLKKYTMQSKDEVASKAKSRLICNVQDINQISALAVIKVFEELWFSKDVEQDPDASTPSPYHFENLMHIKKAPRSRALTNYCKRTHRKNANKACGLMVEGDGSNWDLNIGTDLMDVTETPVLKHICQVLADHFQSMGCPDLAKFIKASINNRENTEVKFKMTSKDKEEQTLFDLCPDLKGYTSVPSIVMAMFRLSGDRGTSSLNHFINAVLWAVALFEHPGYFWVQFPVNADGHYSHVSAGIEISKHRKWIRCVHPFQISPSAKELLTAEECKMLGKGTHVWLDVTALFEGDDSGLYIFGRVAPGKYQAKAIAPVNLRAETLAAYISEKTSGFFQRAGMDMKFNLAAPGHVCELIGTNLLNKGDGLSTSFVPMVLRNLIASSWSVSRQLLQVGLESKEGRNIAYSALMARAVSFPAEGGAGLLARYFHRCAQHYASPDGQAVLSRDDGYKLGNIEGASIDLEGLWRYSRSHHYDEGGMAGFEESDINDIIRLTAGPFHITELHELAAEGPIRPSDCVGRYFPAAWIRTYLETGTLPIYACLGRFALAA